MSDHFIRIDKIAIELKSSLQFIYDSIMRLVSDLLLDLFNNQLSDVIFDIIIGGLNVG